MNSGRRLVRRTLIVLAAVALAAAAWLLIRGGRYLQHEDPVRRADALFVLAGSRLERSLEAADLYRAGYASVIALSPGREEPAEVVARSRGIRFPRETEVIREALVGAGVPRNAIVVGDGSVDNTAEEGTMLRALTISRGWRTVIVVTSKYHTRRTGFAMRRALAGTGVEVIVRASRYDPADPAHWWRHRRDVRSLMEEWPKLIAYWLGLAE
jgi:uncharacterized SAM-binding protein YcdF (DUF218 family)